MIGAYICGAADAMPGIKLSRRARVEGTERSNASKD